MKFIKLIFILLVFSFISFESNAQNSQLSKQINILNNFGAIPFEDGKTVVAEVVFNGLDVNYKETDDSSKNLLTENNLVKVLREQQAMIRVNEGFYGDKVAKTAKVVREWLAGNGYDKAEVAAFGETLPKDQMRLTFSINRGALARVSEVRFEGNAKVSSGELIENFKQCINDGWQIFDARKYQYISQKCSRSLLFDKGYFQAKISEPRSQTVGDSYVVTFEVNEGARYRLGKVKIEGAKAFSEKEILEMFGQKEGDIANGKSLQNFVYEKLKNLYADKGYISYNAEFDIDFVEPKDKSSDGSANLEITIDEGKVFRLGKIEFTGVEPEQVAELRNLFYLADGEIYNHSKIKEGIERLNQTGKFYPIEYDSLEVEERIPVETESVEGSSLLRRKGADEIPSNKADLVIKLKKLE